MPTPVTSNRIKLIMQVENPLTLAADDVAGLRGALLMVVVGVGVIGGRGRGLLGRRRGGLLGGGVRRHGYLLGLKIVCWW